MKHRVLFQSGTYGYRNFRIPALVATSSGVLLAFCAARYGIGDDWDASDLVVRRSTDGGTTWNEMRVLAGDGQFPHDNAVPIASRDGTLHLLFTINTARLFYCTSQDDGQTFTTPVEITQVVQGFASLYPWNVCASGPGHGIELSSGRLLAPLWLSNGGRIHRPSAVVTIFSDDGGKSWQRGELVCQDSAWVKNPSESVLAQLADGRVLISVRNESPQRCRLLAYSADGSSSWVSRYAPDLPEAVCMASLLGLPDGALLHVAPSPVSNQTQPWYGRTAPEQDNRDTHASPLVRQRLVARLSQDAGEHWLEAGVLEPGWAGYSDLARTPDGTLHCFYEAGALGGNMFDPETLTLASFDESWLRPVAGNSALGFARKG